METNLCKCNNCEDIFIDKNPQVDATKYKIEDGKYKSLIPMRAPSYVWFACPNCKTDNYLTDL